MRLFDDYHRDDYRPGRHQESTFEFLNRIASPGWSRIRDEIEGWFALYQEDADAEKARDLRARFQKDDQVQHFGAWWELYVHRLLRGLYPNHLIECEPEFADVDTKADFVVIDDAGAWVIVVECVTTSTGIIDDEGKNQSLVRALQDTMNEVVSQEYFVNVEIVRYGSTQFRKKDVTRKLEAWLDGLDREQVLAARAQNRRIRPDRIEFRGDWVIEVEAFPKTSHRDGDRLIGFGPSVGGMIDDAGALKRAIESKAGRYGTLPCPFVLAIAPTSSSLNADDIVVALFGTRTQRWDPDHPEGGDVFMVKDGCWFTTAPDIDAALLGPAIHPFTIATQLPTLWINPMARYDIGPTLRQLPHVEFAADGERNGRAATIEASGFLGLGAGWPTDPWT